MNHDELSSWKEIADHLRKSVRTAQRYERELGMPVHRLPPPAVDVRASRAEIDAWRLRTSDASLSPAEGDLVPEESAGRTVDDLASAQADCRDAAAPDPPDRRRRSWAWATGLGLLVVLVAVAWVGLWSGRTRPVPGAVRPATSVGLDQGPWPTQGHDMRRSRQSHLAGPARGDDVRLLHSSDVILHYDPVLGGVDQTPLVATSGGALIFGGCRAAHAIDLAGHAIWDSALADAPLPEGTVGFTVDSLGAIFVATHECPVAPASGRVHMHRLAADGRPIWSQLVGEMMWGPAVAPDGSWYTLSDSNLLRGFRASPLGMLWMTDLPGYSQGAIALDSHGNLYIGTDGGHYNQPSLWSLEPVEGHVRWSRGTGSVMTPVVTDSDRICVNDEDTLSCYRDDGKRLWEVKVGSTTGSSAPLAVGHSGTVYVRAATELLAVAPDGALKWRVGVGPGAAIAPGPILDRDENVYAVFGQSVSSFTADGKPRWSRPVPAPGEMIIAASGLLCVVSDRRNIYSIRDAGPGPTDDRK